MFVEIYGRAGCPFCVRAKALAETSKNKLNDFDFNYVNINEAGLTKDDLSKLVGKPVQTVPQVFIDKTPIGGCTDFEAYMKENFNIVA